MAASANDEIRRLSALARKASRAGDWAAVAAGARQILQLSPHSPEGWFLTGLADKSMGKPQQAVAAFTQALRFDTGRYDAAVELAALHWSKQHHAEARSLLENCEPLLDNSPLYLDMAATVWTRLGLHGRAWPLYCKANELQPGIEQFQANLAACAVLLGHIGKAKALYLELLARNPDHQRNHYELSRLEHARDRSHLEQMQQILARKALPPEKNIFLCYAIAKELEDLEDWDESFAYYQRGGDAAAGVARAAGYEVGSDIALIDRIIEVCDREWLSSGLATGAMTKPPEGGERIPIFVTGLPRTGTTLVERIVASHSQVESADETFFLQMAIKRASRVSGGEDMSPRIIVAAARKNIGQIAAGYLAAVEYRLEGRPLFIDKYPFNFLYLGFIAKAFPQARIVYLRRNPMDACFAMYKQSFFRFAYTLEDLGAYYIAWDRLRRHWQAALGERIIEVEYESVVAEPEAQIRLLLERLGLAFEPACLEFHRNTAPSATASSVQVREPAHTRSVNKWLNFKRQLEPLRARLEQAGIAIG